MAVDGYKGNIAVAIFKENIEDTIYKIRATILTGPLEGKDCAVRYSGKNVPIGTMIVRQEEFDWKKSRLDDEPVVGNFVTSDIPGGFEFANSNEVILTGRWNHEMNQNGHSIPFLPRIKDFYDIGFMTRCLYYNFRQGSIVPYFLFKQFSPERVCYERGYPQTPGSAFVMYVNLMNRKERNSDPRVVVADEDINLEGIITPFLNQYKILKGLRCIMMQPHV